MSLFPNRIKIWNKYLQKYEIAVFQYAVGRSGIYVGEETGTKYTVSLNDAWKKAVSLV